MRRFLIFLIGGGGLVLFAIAEVYPEFGTPAIRTVFQVGGITLFVGTWLYVAVERALGFAHSVKKIQSTFKQAKNNPAWEAQKAQVAARTPLKNFLLSLLFVLVAAAFFAFGMIVKEGYSPFGRVILLVFSVVFILLGLITAAHHFRNMVRGK
ncbi:MAG: hypothetical protein HY437_02050 [Candidatus Magasanikbacteria bacterium]|nr:hypothetical protein [Candidatus Magasanikbacteria bacterium]